MSLKEIAKKTGTSISTVSKVLNNTSTTCASRELKEKIWQAARELHYVPNDDARNLKKGKTKIQEVIQLSIVIPRVKSLDDDFFFKELYQHLEIAIFHEGAVLDQVILGTDVEKEAVQNSDGVIILGRCSDALLRRLRQCSPNLVGVWRNSKDYAVDEVICDGRKAAEQAVLYLEKLGHRNIGYIGDCSYESRYVGYTDTMIEENLPIDYSVIMPTNQTRSQGYAAMKKLMEKESPTAVLCANDMTALGALEAMEEQKKKGKKLSVISIDDIEEAQKTKPLLTTIHIPMEDMAGMAVKILLDRINKGHSRTLRVEFSCQIMKRESCFRLKEA